MTSDPRSCHVLYWLPDHRIPRFDDLHVDPLVSAAPRRNLHLQIIAGDDERAVLERQAAVHGPNLRFTEPRRQALADLTDTPRPLANDGAVHTFPHRRRRSPRTIGVREHVDVRQR